MLAFECPKCGSAFQVDEKLASGPIRCFNCNTLIKKPGGDTSVGEVKPTQVDRSGKGRETRLPQKIRRQTAVSESSYEETGSSRRSAWPKVLLILFFLLAAGGGATWWFVLRPKPVEELADARFFPDDPVLVMYVNVDQLQASRAYQLLKESSVISDRDEEMFGQVLGLPLDNIGQVIVAGDLADPEKTTVLVRTRKPVTPQNIIDRKKNGSYKEKPVLDKIVWQGAADGFCVIGDQLVVYGERAGLFKVLERDGPARISEDLTTSLQLIDPARGACLAAHPGSLKTQKLTLLGVSLDRFVKDLATVSRAVGVQTEWQASVKVQVTMIPAVLEKTDQIKDLLTQDLGKIRSKNPDKVEMVKILTSGFWKVPEGKLQMEWDLSPNQMVMPLLHEFRPATFWIRVLQDAKDPRQGKAVKEIVQLGDKGVPELIRVYKDADPKLRQLIAYMLGELGPGAAPAVPVLIQSLQAPEDEVRAAAAVTLGKIGLKARQARAHLLGALKDPSPVVVSAVKTALEKLGDPGSDDIPTLVKALENTDAQVWKHALQKLEDIGIQARKEKTIPEILLSGLIQAMGRGGPAGGAVKETLKKLRPFNTFDGQCLGGFLAKDPNVVLRLYVAQALGEDKVFTKDSVKALLQAFQNDSEVAVRKAAGASLAQIGTPDPDLVRAFFDALRENNPSVQLAAAEAICKFGPKAHEAVPLLIDLLGSRNLELRCKCAEALGRIGKQSLLARPVLEVMQKDKEPMASKAAAAALAQIPPPTAADVSDLAVVFQKNKIKTHRLFAASLLGQLGAQAQESVPAMIAALEDRDLDIRNAAMKILQAIGPGAPGVVMALAKGMKDADPAIRAQAVKALAGAGKAARPVVPQLLEAMKDADQDLRKQILMTLGSMKDDADLVMPAFVKVLLQDKDKDMRLLALKEIQGLGAKAAGIGSHLVKAMNDSDKDIRLQVLNLLLAAKIKDTLVFPVLEKAVMEDRDPKVRALAAKSLGEMGPKAQMGIEVLAQCLQDSDEEVRLEVIRALGKFGPQAGAYVDKLGEALGDKNKTIRSRAAATLAAIGPKAVSVLPRLVKALADADKDVRLQALRAIGGMGKLGPQTKTALEPLAEILKKEDKDTCKEAALAISGLDLDAESRVKYLAYGFRNDDDGVAEDCMNEIKKIGKPAVIHLVRRMNPKNIAPRVRLWCAKTLGNMGSDARDAIIELRNRFPFEPDPMVREEMTQAVQKITGKS